MGVKIVQETALHNVYTSQYANTSVKVSLFLIKTNEIEFAKNKKFISHSTKIKCRIFFQLVKTYEHSHDQNYWNFINFDT